MQRSPWPRRLLPTWLFRLVLVWAALALVVEWRAPSPSPVVSQAFIGFIIAALSALASWLGAAGGAIAAATVTMVQWLSTGLGWLTRRVGDLVSSTGAMFAKAWDVTKRVWFDVLRPVLARIGSWINDLRGWLKAKLGPVFSLLARSRKYILDIYKNILRPILDAIDTARAILQILAKLHVPFAQALDNYLAEVENALWDNYLRLLGSLSKITDVLNSVVTGELLFQRVPFLRTLQRDVPQWARIFWNAQVVGLTPTQRAALRSREYPATDQDEFSQDVNEFYQTGGGKLGPTIQELAALWRTSARAK